MKNAQLAMQRLLEIEKVSVRGDDKHCSIQVKNYAKFYLNSLKNIF